MFGTKMGGSVLPVSVSLTTDTMSGTNGTSFTFTAADIGSPTGRSGLCICVGSGSGANACSGITVGGQAATEQIDINSVTGNAAHLTMYTIAEASLGGASTADIVVSYTSSQDSCVIAVYRLANANMTPTSVVSHLEETSGANPGTISSVNDGAIVGAACLSQSGSDPTSGAWTNLTERTDRLGQAGDRTLTTTAADAFASAQTSLVVTMTPTNAEASALGLLAFGPA